jgi:hypothetical protein
MGRLLTSRALPLLACSILAAALVTPAASAHPASPIDDPGLAPAAPRSFARHAPSGARAFGTTSAGDGCWYNTDDASVNALVVNTATGRIFAGGSFTVAGGAPGDYIAQWNGSQWVAVGTSPIALPVNALAIDGSGIVYAGTYGGVWKWNGTSWSSLGSVNGWVNALAIDGAGNVYAGGSFVAAGATMVNHVAKWNGSSWSALGTGTNNTVNALAIDGSGNVYAGGKFNTAGGGSAQSVAKWNGSAWSALGAGVGGTVYSLVVDVAGNLYVGGMFTSAGLGYASRVAEWNGAFWAALNRGSSYTVSSMVIDGNGALIASGYFPGYGASGLGRWNGADWLPVGTGTDAPVLALARGVGGNIEAAGYFNAAGGVSARHVAHWNGSSWSALGNGIGMKLTGAVTSLSRDAAGNIYAGGPIQADETHVGGAAMWSSGYWSQFADTLPNPADAIMGLSPDTIYLGGAFGVWVWDYGSFLKPVSGHGYALVPDGHGHAYAGGLLPGNGNVCMIDANTVTPLGSGVSDTVFALAVDGSGNLYAGGRFTSAGGNPANHVAVWNGSNWSALGSGLSDVVYALATDAAGNLYAGGSFSGGVARWNGAGWSALGSGTNDVVQALAVDGGGSVYAGGKFTTAGGASANRIARWNYGGWSTLGTGMADSSVYALLVDPGGTLYAGGSFTSAGGMVGSNGLATGQVTWITGFTPATASIGNKVTIYGKGFFSATDARFGTVSASGYALSDTSLLVTVPALPATSVPIQVLTSCTTATALTLFNSEGCLINGLVAWWPAEFDARDVTSNHHDGTLMNGAICTAQGLSGAAFSLDGVNDNITVPDDPAFGFTSAMSVEGWINTTAGTERYIATKHEDSFYFAVGGGSVAPHKLSFWLNGVTSSWVTGTTPIDDGAWHHVAATYDGASVKLYVDAGLDASVAASGTIATGTSPVLIGARSDGNNTSNFAGSIDELAIFNRALNLREISGMAYPGGTGPCGVTSVDDAVRASRSLELAPPWPNPASRVMSFEFRLPHTESVRAEIVDVAGRRVSMPLESKGLAGGVHRFQWDGRNASGEPVAPGVYLIRVRAGSEAAVQRIVLVR